MHGTDLGWRASLFLVGVVLCIGIVVIVSLHR
jgi:hypothetical protein